MNSEPKPAQKGVVKGFIRSLPRRVWHTLSHNWPWKLLCLLLAVGLWAGLISQDPTLTRERVFTDVEVSFSGAETLQNNGFIVLTDYQTDPISVRLRAAVPQRVYSSVQASNYNPRVDLSKITSTGVQSLRVVTTSTTSYGAVTDVSPAEIELVVDEYISNYRIPVSVNRIGSWPEGFYGTVTTVSPSTVTISGPRSLVEQVARVRVDFDVSQLPASAGIVSTGVPYVLCDANGNELRSSLLRATSGETLLRSITVDQELCPTKELQLSEYGLITGKPADGYEVKSVTATPTSVLAAGDETGLAALESLFADQPIDVSGADATFTRELPLRKPAEIDYLSTDTVTVLVEIGPIIESKSFDSLALTFRGAEDRKIACDIGHVSVTLTGPTNTLRSIKAVSVRPYIDVGALTADGYELPIELELDSVDSDQITYVISPDKASFTLGE